MAVVNAGATSLLIVPGGMVSNTGSGLAVPDWPMTFGHNMVLYPWCMMPMIRLCGLLVLQLFFAVGAYLARFTGVPLPLGEFSVLATPVVHRLNGRLFLATSLVVSLRSYRVVRWPRLDFARGLVSKRVPA